MRLKKSLIETFRTFRKHFGLCQCDRHLDAVVGTHGQTVRRDACDLLVRRGTSRPPADLAARTHSLQDLRLRLIQQDEISLKTSSSDANAVLSWTNNIVVIECCFVACSSETEFVVSTHLIIINWFCYNYSEIDWCLCCLLILMVKIFRKLFYLHI